MNSTLIIAKFSRMREPRIAGSITFSILTPRHSTSYEGRFRYLTRPAVLRHSAGEFLRHQWASMSHERQLVNGLS